MGVIMIEWIQTLDAEILLFFQEYIRCPVLTAIFSFITMLGSGGLLPIVTSFVLMLPKKTRKVGFICATALLLSFLFNNLLIKNLVARVRPYEVIEGLKLITKRATDYSFPSGHTANTCVVAFVIFVFAPKKIGIPVLIFSVLMGISRIYLGVHYPSDVVAGFLSGGGIGYVSAIIGRKLISGKPPLNTGETIEAEDIPEPEPMEESKKEE